MGRLEGQSVLITGGGSGLGLGIVERFVDEGANLTVVDHSEEKLAALGEKFGDRVVPVVGDVRSAQDNQRAVDACLGQFGKLDCAIGNAGIWDYNTSLDDIPVEQLDQSFDEVFGVNVKGYLHLAKAALPALVRSRGSLLFTVSNAGFNPAGGGPLYTATKHAVVGLIRQLAFEFAPHVKVNGIAPGPIATDLRGPAALGMDGMDISSIGIGELAAPVMPLEKVPSPAEYAGAYVMYASREDNGCATGGVMYNEVGISVRGIGMVNAGKELAEKYQNSEEKG